jgi:hypothetical protein
MAQLPAKKKKSYKDINVVLNNRADRAKLQNLIDEAVKYKQEIFSKNEEIKLLKETAADDLSVDPKDFNCLVKMTYNNDFKKVRETAEKTIDMVEGILSTPALSN